MAAMIRAHRSWNVLVGLGSLFLSFGCVEPPGAEHIVGPDGTSMLHVHCAAEQAACFQIAGERCPHGYDLSPIFDPHDGNFLVRCREPQIMSVAASPSANRATTNGAAAASDRWPPTEVVARPSEPWPTPAASSSPPPAPSANGGVDIDIGY